ncbi:MAG TPA: NAD(P)H-dependent oxidoreductase [Ilumatobacteraceae bacterium]|nr:NAD(P)H-dependent oxidoreductase [Ilumatobacteraceae bacterium]
MPDSSSTSSGGWPDRDGPVVKVVVAYAHPCAESYVASVRDRVMSGLSAAGCEPLLIDLYESSYDPYLPLPVADAQSLDGAESLVLVHPTWWTSHPAILLAWITQATDTGLPGVRSLVSVTTLGGSKLANRLAGEAGARVIDRAVRRQLVEHPPHRRMALYGLDQSTPERRQAFLDRVETRIGGLVR